MQKKNIYIFLIALLALLITPLFVKAAGVLLPDCAASGDCGINHLVQVFVNFMRYLLGIVGSAVLFYFVYGGFMWIISGGDEKLIIKGRDIVKNSVIGLVIVFGAVTMVQFIAKGLGATNQPGSTGCTFAQMGLECTEGNGDNARRGICIPDKDDPVKNPPTCATGCETNPSLSEAGYKCKVPAEGENCIVGLCTISTESCCKESGNTPAAAGGTPAAEPVQSLPD